MASHDVAVIRNKITTAQLHLQHMLAALKVMSPKPSDADEGKLAAFDHALGAFNSVASSVV